MVRYASLAGQSGEILHLRVFVIFKPRPQGHEGHSFAGSGIFTEENLHRGDAHDGKPPVAYGSLFSHRELGVDGADAGVGGTGSL